MQTEMCSENGLTVDRGYIHPDARLQSLGWAVIETVIRDYATGKSDGERWLRLDSYAENRKLILSWAGTSIKRITEMCERARQNFRATGSVWAVSAK